ncbi:uncharacterized protein PAC_15091 [Phialocephala subalpina]|uniref:NAD(P)-binding protein n=1 Tax=Phialocephala subalpina TaxID=576137 RepID=A0A1L7XJH4_9HELO|nr:uncharacterized protein PAC_15091 [Phialocephala subalpina]
MANQENNSDAAIPVPSQWWCLWQALKGTNFRQLTIPDVDLRNKWIVLTGGNSGVGREAALQFVKWGANIVLGCREPPPHEPHPDAVVEELKAAALDAGHLDTVIEWWSCDMSSLKSVEEFGKRWLEKDQALDILVNNAGLGGGVFKTKYTVDGFELIHQVNFLSHVLLTKILLPSLARTPSPRITCTTSCMQYLGTFNLSNANSGKYAYQNNKLYFQTWLTELQAQMSARDRYKHIVIQGVHPGYVKTNIWVSPSPEKSKNTGWLKWSLNALLKYVGIDAQQGSLAITYAATAPDWGLERITAKGKVVGGGGRYCNRIWEETPMPQTRDPDCRRKIWEFVSEELKVDKDWV